MGALSNLFLTPVQARVFVYKDNGAPEARVSLLAIAVISDFDVVS